MPSNSSKPRPEKPKMKPHILTLTYLLLGVIYCFFSSAGSTSILPKDPFLGISPQDETYYKSSGDVIKCKDGSRKFTKAQLNDDFCDCPDGSDEPGTSACPTGKFYCRNAGHSPILLFSSRVNDGICDCCDGSDEYDGKVKCQNTCWEAGNVARDKLKKKIATYQEGVTIRNQEIEKAKLAIAKDETELSKLKNEEKTLKGLVQELKERKEQIEKAEEEERLRKENEEKAAEEDEKKNGEMKSEDEKKAVNEEEKPTETNNDDAVRRIDEDVEDYNELISEATNDGRKEGYNVDGNGKNDGDDKEALKLEHEADLNEGSPTQVMEPEKVSESDELSREELGRLVASRWTGENAGPKTEETHDVKSEDHESHDDPSKDVHDEQYDEYATDSDNDIQRYDDHDEETEDPIDDFEEEDHHDKYDSHDDSYSPDVATPSNPSWLEKIQQTVRSIIQSVNLFKTPVNISEAGQVRKEYDESSAKLSKIESRISSLTQKLKQDFGPQKEFYSFYDHCFESKQNKYVYKVCPFKQASQVEGHSKTSLGHWDKFDDSYKSMVFSNGDKCWNGPDRSLKVKLRCGLTNEITDVDEPSRCEYVALLATPALCQEDKLKELQHKLELMNKEQPSGHDEL